VPPRGSGQGTGKAAGVRLPAPDLVLFTYLHLAAYPDVGRALLDAAPQGWPTKRSSLDTANLPCWRR